MGDFRTRRPLSLSWRHPTRAAFEVTGSSTQSVHRSDLLTGSNPPRPCAPGTRAAPSTEPGTGDEVPERLVSTGRFRDGSSTSR